MAAHQVECHYMSTRLTSLILINLIKLHFQGCNDGKLLLDHFLSLSDALEFDLELKEPEHI